MTYIKWSLFLNMKESPKKEVLCFLALKGIISIPNHPMIRYIAKPENHFRRLLVKDSTLIKRIKNFLSVYFILILLNLDIVYGQTIKRLDGSKISVDSLSAKIQYLMTEAKVAGLAISIFNKNKPVFKQTFGLADVQRKKILQPSSVMYGASLSKVVFAYIVMQMVQEQIIELDRPLITYLKKPLPDYPIKDFMRGYRDLKEDKRYEKITARMCLTHTTGLPNWRWLEDDKKLKINFEPGTRYSYSGEGLYLLQFVIEQFLSKDYESISQERVFKPLHMSNTSQVWQARFNTNICYGHDANGQPYQIMKWRESNASGSMSTTLDDFTRFYTALISHKGLSKRNFNLMTTRQIRIKSKKQFGTQAQIESMDNDNIMLGYGLGVGTFTTPYGRAFFKEGHDEGWGHYSICFPDKKIALVIMTNNDNGESIFKELLEYAIGDTFTPWYWENYIPYKKVN